jgi:DNA-binding LacI/PurR family transcriptional regulator
VARDSGVSPATVSLVWRDQPGISPETRHLQLSKADFSPQGGNLD